MNNKYDFMCYVILMLMLISVMCSCGKNDETHGGIYDEHALQMESAENMKDAEELSKEKSEEQIKKGYELPINDSERQEAEDDCKRVMELIFKDYEYADKSDSSNVVLSNEVLCKMKDKVREKGFTVNTGILYSDMENYDSMDDFLKECINGKSGSAVIYEIHFDGGIGRSKYVFDGKDMYVLDTNIMWNKDNQPKIAYISYSRVKEWKYTDKGWFCYKLCVPELPDVTEIVDGSRLLRIKPMSPENRYMSEKCLSSLAYHGSNILCSDWNEKNMENLDYNGMYEYLYAMKYQKEFNPYEYTDGIPKEEFESLIQEYFPITADKIQEYAVFDEEKQTYVWARLGCLNYSPTYFGTSTPEVTDIRENEDGTVTLTVDAVCDMVLCDDAVITHELTVMFAEDGSFKYLSNKILNSGIENIPEYQYRIINNNN